MRFYTKQHQFYCGIDLHARTMYLCILNQDGEILVHRNMPAGPEPFLKAVAPYRTDLVVCVECLFTWYWLADLCAREGIPFVLGHALSMQASHGGKAKNDTIDAQKIAALLRGGMLPQAYVYPAALRATRDGGAERFPDPAVQQSIAVDLARIGHYDQLLRDVELSLLQTAKPHNAQTLSLLR